MYILYIIEYMYEVFQYACSLITQNKIYVYIYELINQTFMISLSVSPSDSPPNCVKQIINLIFNSKVLRSFQRNFFNCRRKFLIQRGTKLYKPKTFSHLKMYKTIKVEYIFSFRDVQNCTSRRKFLIQRCTKQYKPKKFSHLEITLWDLVISN